METYRKACDAIIPFIVDQRAPRQVHQIILVQDKKVITITPEKTEIKENADALSSYCQVVFVRMPGPLFCSTYIFDPAAVAAVAATVEVSRK